MDVAPAPVSALDVSSLRKEYRVGFLQTRRSEALKGVSFSVRQGEIFGYLGPNGSGKTTTLKLLLGLIFPTSGSAHILGLPIEDRRWRYRAGYLPEHPYFYDYLTPREYLDYCGRLLAMPRSLITERTSTLLALVGLRRSQDTPLRRFSKGMVQRLGLAQALLNDPELLFLDEPMSGLDPIGRRMVRDIISSQRERGKTVFFSTHILSDAETLCDRIAVLRGGELLATGRLDDILNIDVAYVEVLTSGVPADAVATLGVAADRCSVVGDRVRLQVGEGDVARLVTAVHAAGGRLLSVAPVRQSLEDYFFKELGGSEVAARALEAEE